MSPSRSTSAINIPHSPQHVPLYPSALSASGPSLTTRHTKSHPYTRPMTSRSRAASPAQSVAGAPGSRAGMGLSQAFVPIPEAAPHALGGLGLLTLSGERRRDGRGGVDGVDMVREDSGESREAMEED